MGKLVENMTRKQYKHKQKHNAWYYKTILRPKRKRNEQIKILKNSIPEIAKAYIAGFIDGEGTMGLYKLIRKKNKIPEIGINFNACNTKKASLIFIDKYFKGSITKRTRPHLSHKNLYLFSFSTNLNLLYNALFQLKPYLIIKKPQAKLLMKYCKIRTKEKCKWNYKHGNNYTKEEWTIVDKIHNLNK